MKSLANMNRSGLELSRAALWVKKNSTLNKKLDDLDSFIDRQKQYSCEYWLLLHGLEEESNENTNQRVTNVLSKPVGEIISIQEVDRTHRYLRKNPTGKSRPVIADYLNCRLFEVCMLQHQGQNL